MKIGHDDTLYNCKFTLSRLEKEQKKWPFNREGRSMSIWFSSIFDFKPIRFEVKTPIGGIIGKYNIDWVLIKHQTMEGGGLLDLLLKNN